MYTHIYKYTYIYIYIYIILARSIEKIYYLVSSYIIVCYPMESLDVPSSKYICCPDIAGHLRHPICYNTGVLFHPPSPEDLFCSTLHVFTLGSIQCSFIDWYPLPTYLKYPIRQIPLPYDRRKVIHHASHISQYRYLSRPSYICLRACFLLCGFHICKHAVRKSDSFLPCSSQSDTVTIFVYAVASFHGFREEVSLTL